MVCSMYNFRSVFSKTNHGVYQVQRRRHTLSALIPRMFSQTNNTCDALLRKKWDFAHKVPFNRFSPSVCRNVSTESVEDTVNNSDHSCLVEASQNVESFADFGLGGWNYPHHWLQNILEYLHVEMNISWISTIAIATLAFRMIAFPTYIKMRQYNTRSQNYYPQQMEFQKAILEANPIERKRKKLEYMQFLEEKQINPVKPLLYSLPVGGIFLSFFAALRGIVKAQVPSFTCGGMLWFNDLTLTDPYFILPTLVSFSIFVLIRCGAASAEVGPVENIPLMKNILNWLPLISFPFLVFQPCCMLVFWLTSNSFSLFVMFLFFNRNIRKFFNIPIMVVHPQSVRDQFKVNSMMSSVKKAKEQAAVRQKALEKAQTHIKKINQFQKKKKN